LWWKHWCFGSDWLAEPLVSLGRRKQLSPRQGLLAIEL